jgi:hypothetical protein
MRLPAGFLQTRPKSASGKELTGRFVCHDIQWTGGGDELLGTFTITARELLDAAESNLIWTDQDVQRGVRPECPDAPRQLSLANGYPDENEYIFNRENADEIADKLLYGRKLYLSPLVWNLRPGTFEAYRDDKNDEFAIFSGKVYLPDSHHRHQGIIKAAKIYRENPNDYPSFSLEKQFKVDIYFLSKIDEGNFFYDKNQLTRQTSKSKAFDLTTEDALSLLAKEIANNSTSLRQNVNRVTDRLTAKNPQLLTLSTLREVARTIVPSGEVTEGEIEGIAAVVGGFFDMLAQVRPELGLLSAADRRQVRQNSLVDSGVMMHGYAALARDFMADLPKGTSEASSNWLRRLNRLRSNNVYTDGTWSGDLFDKGNPLWRRVGIIKPSSKGAPSQVNTGATRSTAGRVLRAVLNSQSLDLQQVVP